MEERKVHNPMVVPVRTGADIKIRQVGLKRILIHTDGVFIVA
jgi:hypothetical protein